MISRDEAYSLVKKYISKRNLVKHVLAVEIIMKDLAARFDQDVDCWGLAGLLHDLDYEDTEKDPDRHGHVTMELISDLDLSDEIRHAILAHADQVERISLMDKAIYCADPVTGLIVASVLMHPAKSLAGTDAAFVGKRFKEKRFAAGANREAIASCSELGLDLHEFLEISLGAMGTISDELGL
ncbi:MAG: HDIG domain-containing protein [Candidatus Krumholzibacteria bacterium]|nr:HDIG domain-containing protein [Candidatus Krumholzibacteria bacterium]